MYKAKFFRVAGSLDPKSWKRFRKYVQTRPGKRSESLVHFLEQIYPAHPAFDAPWIERKALHARIFPDLPHRDQRLYDHLSYLYDLLEAFLLDENRPGDLIGDELVLADYFRRSHLGKDFQLAVKKAKQKLESAPKSPERALAAYRLASLQEAHYSDQLKEQARTAGDGLQEKLDALEMHFLRVRFQYSCEMLNRQNVIGTAYETATLAQALQLYETFPERFAGDPLIGGHYQVLQMFLDPGNVQAYQALREMLEEQSETLPQEAVRNLYVYAQNFCIRRINQGEAAYLEELFALYQEMLERGTIFESGRLSQWDYKNIVSLGLRLEKSDWVAGFIESGREKIAPDYQINAYAYNRAYFDYATRNYPAALRRLQQVDFADVFYHLGTKAIQMKIFFEMEEAEALWSLLSTFKIYLRRQKGISAYQRRTHLNLVKFVEQLDRIREKSERLKADQFVQELRQLEAKIRETKGVSNLSWLLGQVEGLVPVK